MRKALIALMAAALLAPAAAARDVGGVDIPETLRVAGKDLALNGAGIRTKVFFKVYAGALYLPGPSSSAAAIVASDGPMAIRLHFLMDVDAKSIQDAWNEGFRAGSAGSGGSAGSASSAGSFEAPADKVSRFNACFAEDSRKGTIYDIVYDPAEGTMVKINGVVKDVIPGADFKKAVFAIWLGDKPADKGLKKGLLGG